MKPFEICVFLVIITTNLQNCVASLHNSTCPTIGSHLAKCSCKENTAKYKNYNYKVLCTETDWSKMEFVLNEFRAMKPVPILSFELNAGATSIPNDIFEGLQIQSLAFRNTNLETLPKAVLEPIADHVEILEIVKNTFMNWPFKIFKFLNATKTLIFRDNQISSLDKEAFSGLTSLEKLNLAGNKISSIHRAAFVGLERLTELDLRRNWITEFPTESFQNLRSLKRLVLSSNRIATLIRNDFTGMQNLTKLFLSGNYIQSLPGFVFSELRSLKELDLDGNKIASVDENAFAGVKDSLIALGLSSNELSTMPASALGTYNVLKLPTFQNAIISGLTIIPGIEFPVRIQRGFVSFNDLLQLRQDLRNMPSASMELIDLLGNPLVCDCKLLWYKKWVQRNYVLWPNLDSPCWSKDKARQNFTLLQAQISEEICAPELPSGFTAFFKLFFW